MGPKLETGSHTHLGRIPQSSLLGDAPSDDVVLL